MCNSEKDSKYHMLITCNKVSSLWKDVETWIRNLGMDGYHLTERRKIIGDLENTGQINIIILNTKKNFKVSVRVPSLQYIRLNIMFNNVTYMTDAKLS